MADTKLSYLITCNCGRTTVVSPIEGTYTADKVGWTQRERPFINDSDIRIAEGWYCGRREHMISNIEMIIPNRRS